MTTCSAPSARANSILSSLPTVVMTRAPTSRAIWIAALPMPLPAACTSTVWPGLSSALTSSACHDVRNASGSAAPASKLTDSCNGRQLAASTFTRSAYPPSLCAPR